MKNPVVLSVSIVCAAIVSAFGQNNLLLDKGPRSISEKHSASAPSDERAVSSRTWEGIADEYLNVHLDKLVLAAAFCIQANSEGLRVEGQVPGTERYEVYGTRPSTPGGFTVVGLKANAKMLMADAIAKFGSPSSVEDGGAVKRYFWGPIYLIASHEKTVPHGLGIDYRLYRETTGTFKETPGVSNRPAELPQSTSAQESVARSAPSSEDKTKQKQQMSPLPRYKEELRGTNPVRVRNPNDFAVLAGIRAGEKGKDFDIPANGVDTVYIPHGRYDIYFVYSDKPDALFQGDAFTLNDNGVEIQIVKVVNGNYGIRQVK